MFGDCVGKIIQNLPKRGKSAAIWKIRIQHFNKLRNIRRLGSSGVLPENPRAGSSILSVGNIVNSSRGNSPELFVFDVGIQIDRNWSIKNRLNPDYDRQKKSG